MVFVNSKLWLTNEFCGCAKCIDLRVASTNDIFQIRHMVVATYGISCDYGNLCNDTSYMNKFTSTITNEWNLDETHVNYGN